MAGPEYRNEPRAARRSRTGVRRLEHKTIKGIHARAIGSKLSPLAMGSVSRKGPVRTNSARTRALECRRLPGYACAAGATGSNRWSSRRK